MPDILSILTHKTLPLAKTWHADGSISDYAKPKHFSLEEITIDGIKNLSALLFTLERTQRRCLIRGKYTGDSSHHTMRRKEVFIDQPLHSFMVEIDKFRPVLSDHVLDPVDAIEEYIITQLPPCFQGVKYHWQLSNSAGSTKNAGLLKCHVWFYLETAYTSAQLRAWAKNKEIYLDISTLDTVQIHYTAAPIFENTIDPVSVRSGFIAHKIDTVPLILDSDSMEAKAKAAPKGEAYQGNDKTALWLEENNLAKGTGENGKLFLDCPFAENHTDGKISETDTTYLPARVGFPDSLFHCSHASCADRSNFEFECALGITASDFDIVQVTETEENVTKEKLSNRFKLYNYNDFANREPPGYIIDKILPRAEFGIMYGASTAGKSFVALDMAFAIARGTPWNGHATVKGRVVYVCAEGAGAFSKRVKAYMLAHDITSELPFQIIADSPNFFLKEDAIELAKAIGKADMIFDDTLAQTSVGANENSAEDIAKILANIKGIHRVTGALVMPLHHEGKDENKGARGSTSLRAGADVEIRISRVGGDRVIEVTKQKDGEDGLKFGFSLQPVTIDLDNTSCVVDYVPVKTRTKIASKMRIWQLKTFEALDHFSENGKPALQEEVIKYMLINCIARDLGTDDKGKLKPDRRRDEIIREFKTLIAAGEIDIKNGIVNRPLNV